MKSIGSGRIFGNLLSAVRPAGSSKTKAANRQAGQAIVEFALAVPLLLTLAFGIMEFGRLFFAYSSVVTAAREAARVGSLVDNYQDCAGIQAAAVRVGGLAGVETSNVHISYDDGFGGNVRACPPGNLPLGSRVIVELPRRCPSPRSCPW